MEHHCFSRRRFLGGMGAVAAGLTLINSRAIAVEEKKLNFYNWSDYIGETTIADFKAETGIAVKTDLFADNDELFAKLREGNPGYDVIVPSNDIVEQMRKVGIVQPLNHGKIPNIANIDPFFLDVVFDPGRRYSLPYMWGTTGIGYRKSKVDGVPDSWKWLFESDRYAGRTAILDSPGEVFPLAYKYLGYSVNNTDPSIIQQTTELLIRQKQHIKAFSASEGQNLLLSGEVDLVMEFNGDVLQIMAEDDDIAYVVPKEGSLLWEDALCIPTDAPHPENAHAFINYLLDAEAGAAIADYIQFATPNAAAWKFMSADYLEDPAIFPPESIKEKLEVYTYKGEDYDRLLDEAWTRIKAA